MIAIAPFHDRIGDRLDHPERVAPAYRHLIPDDRQRVARLLAIPIDPAAAGLDVGCGTGAIPTRIQHQFGVPMLGADGAPRPARGRPRRDTPFFFRWDVRTPYPPLHQWRTSWLLPPYRTIYCCEVLEHLTPAEASLALTHLWDLLRIAGQLICSVPNRDCAEIYTAGCRDRWRWPDHRSVWTRDRVATAMRDRCPGAPITWHPLYPHDTPAESIWLLWSIRRP